MAHACLVHHVQAGATDASGPLGGRDVTPVHIYAYRLFHATPA
jgi:hypothetical protein